MSSTTNSKSLKEYVFELSHAADKPFKEILYYSGTFNETMISQLGDYVRGWFHELPELGGKVFAIFVEMAQNIELHSLEKDPNTNKGLGVMGIYEIDDKEIRIFAANKMPSVIYDEINEHCKKINSLSHTELRAFKRTIRSAPRSINQKGGHIGLVQVAIKSKNPINIQILSTEGSDNFCSISTDIKVPKNKSMSNLSNVENLSIEGVHGTFYTPSVSFITETGVCSIQGESYLEDAFEFYDNLVNWFARFFESGGDNIDLSFKLSYFNTSSSRAIVDMIRVLKKHKDDGKNIKISWHYPVPDHDDMLLEGEDFAEESEFPITFVEYSR